MDRYAGSLGMLALMAISLAAVIGAAFWINHRFAVQNPGGNDFLVHWVGTRALIMEGESPYSDAVALEIQRRAYGRPARPGEHELRVAYPLYASLIFAPFAVFGDYNLARALWMTSLEIALVALAWISLRLVGWRPRLWLLALYLCFSLLWYHSLRPLINGNAVILVALLTALALEAIRQERDEAAGLLLALATVKPHLVVVLIAFILFWSLSRRRWPVALWFMIGMVFLSVIPMFLIPDWPLQNLREVLRYPGYNPPGTPGAIFALWLPAVGARLGWLLTLSLAGLLIWEWTIARDKGFGWFLWTACLTLTASQWLGIQTDPGNFIIMFPALAMVFSVWEDRWGLVGTILILASMLFLGVGLWALFLRTVAFGAQPQQHPVMFFPLPLFSLTGLYWVRWWAVRPLRLWMDVIREREA